MRLTRCFLRICVKLIFTAKNYAKIKNFKAHNFFDLFLKLKKLQTMPKLPIVHGSKINKSVIPTAKNVLDSSAPAKRRGKEREKPKKKKHTTMKKLILLEREGRRDLRLANLELSKKQSEVAKKIENLSITASPCPPGAKDDFDQNASEICKENQIKIPDQSNQQKAKLKLHSRKFRR